MKSLEIDFFTGTAGFPIGCAGTPCKERNSSWIWVRTVGSDAISTRLFAT